MGSDMTDASRWQAILDRVRPDAAVNELYFRHTYGAGWQAAPPDELRYVGYYDQSIPARVRWPRPLS